MRMPDRRQLPDILAEGKFDRRRVTVQRIGKGISLSREQEHYIREQWQQFVKDWITSNSGFMPRPYAGQLYRLLHFGLSDRVLHMSLGEVSYDQFAVSRTAEFIERFGDIKAIPVGVTAVVTTSDDYVVLGKGTFGPQEIGAIAGYMEREDPHTHEELSPHPFDQVEREVAEETGVHAGDIQSTTCLGIISHDEPVVAFDVTLRIPFSVLVHERKPRDLEFRRFLPIRCDPDSVRTYIVEKEAIMTLHCISSLLLWGKYTFGRNWFETLADLLGSLRRQC